MTNPEVEEQPAPLHISSPELASHNCMPLLVEKKISPFKSLLYDRMKSALAGATRTTGFGDALVSSLP